MHASPERAAIRPFSWPSSARGVAGRIERSERLADSCPSPMASSDISAAHGVTVHCVVAFIVIRTVDVRSPIAVTRPTAGVADRVCALRRPNRLVRWSSVGGHHAQSVGGISRRVATRLFPRAKREMRVHLAVIAEWWTAAPIHAAAWVVCRSNQRTPSASEPAFDSGSRRETVLVRAPGRLCVCCSGRGGGTPLVACASARALARLLAVDSERAGRVRRQHRWTLCAGVRAYPHAGCVAPFVALPRRLAAESAHASEINGRARDRFT